MRRYYNWDEGTWYVESDRVDTPRDGKSWADVINVEPLPKVKDHFEDAVRLSIPKVSSS